MSDLRDRIAVRLASATLHLASREYRRRLHAVILGGMQFHDETLRLVQELHTTIPKEGDHK